ncbi:MAG: lipoyl(octanoyl) transferase LipB [Gammaproteobacteria bacterium]|nr:lipoyl(octanoyl) transferase LipB [Gammaproteobacteria bacterium]
MTPPKPVEKSVWIRDLGLCDYTDVWQAMKLFTDSRTKQINDEFWFVEHNPVFTQGQAGKAEHILVAGNIPVVHADRGGQVTYHGPGQQLVYIMIDLQRRGLGVRQLVTGIENGIIQFLAQYGIQSQARADAPGVYLTSGEKICSIGLRIRKGCSFHGLALNIAPDLEPFTRINPCGFEGLQVTSLQKLGCTDSLSDIHDDLADCLADKLGYAGWRKQYG